MSLCELHLAAAYGFCADRIAEDRYRRQCEQHAKYVEERRARAEETFARAIARPDEQGFLVYYIRFADRVKIGFTSNLRNRLADLQYEELLAVEVGGRPTEALRHKQFAKYRVIGEWFELSDELRDHIEHLPEIFSFDLLESPPDPGEV